MKYFTECCMHVYLRTCDALTRP